MIFGGEKRFDVEIDIDMEPLQTPVFFGVTADFWKGRHFNPIQPGLFLGAWARGGGGGGRKVPAAHNTETYSWYWSEIW